MKYVIPVCVLILMFVFNSCSTNIFKDKRRSLIIGLWKTEKVDVNFKTSSNFWKGAIDDAKNTIYVFNEDNTAEIRVRNITNKSKWELNGDWLVFKREDEQMKYKLLKINAGKMVMVSVYPNGEVKYFLSKINE